MSKCSKFNKLITKKMKSIWYILIIIVLGCYCITATISGIKMSARATYYNHAANAAWQVIKECQENDSSFWDTVGEGESWNNFQKYLGSDSVDYPE